LPVRFSLFEQWQGSLLVRRLATALLKAGSQQELRAWLRLPGRLFQQRPCLDRILRKTLPEQIQVAQHGLGKRLALRHGQAIPFDCFAEVAFRAQTLHQRYAEVGLRIRVAVLGGFPEPDVGLRFVRFDSLAVAVHQAQVVLADGIALLRGPAIPALCLCRVLPDALALFIQAAEIGLGLGMALLGSGVVKACSLGDILRHAISGLIGMGKLVQVLERSRGAARRYRLVRQGDVGDCRIAQHGGGQHQQDSPGVHLFSRGFAAVLPARVKVCSEAMLRHALSLLHC